MYLKSNSSVQVANNISANKIQFSFSAIQSSTVYFMLLNTNIGVAYSNNFYVEVIKCSPTISVNP
jgi:hypothetical protein